MLLKLDMLELKELLLWNPEDVKKCYKLAKNAKIIPAHMNSFPHCLFNVDLMKKYAKDNNIQDRVLVPKDGEILKI